MWNVEGKKWSRSRLWFSFHSKQKEAKKFFFFEHLITQKNWIFLCFLDFFFRLCIWLFFSGNPKWIDFSLFHFTASGGFPFVSLCYRDFCSLSRAGGSFLRRMRLDPTPQNGPPTGGKLQLNFSFTFCCSLELLSRRLSNVEWNATERNKWKFFKALGVFLCWGSRVWCAREREEARPPAFRRKHSRWSIRTKPAVSLRFLYCFVRRFSHWFIR